MLAALFELDVDIVDTLEAIDMVAAEVKVQVEIAFL
jgi:hypothetical protein